MTDRPSPAGETGDGFVDPAQEKRPDIVCTADEMNDALWYLHDHNMGITAETIMERLAFISEVSGSRQSDRIPRTADQFLDEEYTYVEPRFAAAFCDGWNAHEREVAAPPEPPRPDPDLQRAVGIIEAADARCLAADGPVGHLRDEMTDHEWREMYVALTRALARSVAPEGQPLDVDRDRLFDEIDKRFGRNVARFVDDRLAAPERPEAGDA